jgi:hypothetical protein
MDDDQTVVEQDDVTEVEPLDDGTEVEPPDDTTLVATPPHIGNVSISLNSTLEATPDFQLFNDESIAIVINSIIQEIVAKIEINIGINDLFHNILHQAVPIDNYGLIYIFNYYI